MKAVLVATALLWAFAVAFPTLSASELAAIEEQQKAENITCTYPNEIFADFDDCSAYYVCSNDEVPVPEHVTCPPSYSFSNQTLTCIYPYDITQCANPGTLPPTTTVIYEVECQYESQILHDPVDCAVYYLCDSNKIPQYFHCSTTLWYDPAYAGCNFITRVQCDNGVRPTPIPSAFPVPDFVGTKPNCTRPADLYGDYSDCQYYWKCNSLSEPEPFKCPPDLLFDHFTDVCELPQIANCFVRQ